MHGRLDCCGVGGRRDHDDVNRATRRANDGEQIQPVILLHIDIQQHQIDRLAWVGDQRLGLVERGSDAAAAKTLNAVNIQTVEVGYHGVIIDN